MWSISLIQNHHFKFESDFDIKFEFGFEIEFEFEFEIESECHQLFLERAPSQIFDWVLNTSLELLQKWNYYIYAHTRVPIHMNDKETVFKGGSDYS